MIDKVNENCNNYDVNLKRRVRTTFTDEQRKKLLKVFEKQMYPTNVQIEDLSMSFKVTTHIVQVSLFFNLVFT